MIADEGISAASARTIAARAAAAPSAINYNFGNIEQLLQAVFEHGAEETRAWLADRAAELAALPATPDAAGLALLHVICAWTSSDSRRLALLYQEALAAQPGVGPVAAWTRLWRDFWAHVAERLGRPALDGRILHAAFEQEALYHLSTWSPALETAALAEMTDFLAATWLGAPTREPRGLLDQAARMAGARPHGSIPAASLRIAKAAAEVVETSGLAGLTHRAVAARADVTTGSVTHHFRSIEDLVAGAIRGQVLMMTEEAAESSEEAPAAVDDIQTADQLFDALRSSAISDVPVSAALRRRRLFLAAIRRQELAAAGAVIRYSYGGTTRDALERLFLLPESQRLLHASVLARLVSAIWFACAGDETPTASRGELVDRILAPLRAQLTPRAELGWRTE